MKILIVANYAKEHINKFHKKTINLLKEEGWTVDVACRLDEPIPECDKSYDIGCNRNPFSPNSLRAIKKLSKIIDSGNYDYIHCHTLAGRFIGAMALKKLKNKQTKLVYTYHGLNVYKGSSLISKLFIPFEKFLSRKLAFGFCNNTEDASLLKRITKKEIEICYPSLNLEKFKVKDEEVINKSVLRKDLGFSDEDLLLTYVAEINKNKNQRFLLNVLNELLKYNKNFKLVLVGPDHSNGNFAKLIKKKELTDKVCCLGWRNDIRNILFSSDVYVASSIREGFGLNILEAQYCKNPVVATDNRGHREIIKDDETGFLVNKNNYKEFANKILTLVENNKIEEKIVDCAFKNLSFYQDRNMEDVIINKYSKLK